MFFLLAGTAALSAADFAVYSKSSAETLITHTGHMTNLLPAKLQKKTQTAKSYALFNSSTGALLALQGLPTASELAGLWSVGE
jgi:hypothetical protein